MTPPKDETRDPADALLAARTVDGIEEEAPTPDEAELIQRVREDRERTKKMRRSIAIAGLAAIALVAALLWSQRAARTSATTDDPATTTAPTSAPETSTVSPERPPSPVATAPSEPATARPANEPQRPPAPRVEPRRAEPAWTPRETVDLPARASRQSPRDVARQAEAPRAEPPARAEAPRDEPAAMARVSRPASDLRVEVAHVPNGGSVDYTVKVSWPDGAPMKDADVRVRGIMSDGGLVEARLDPGAEPGVYRGLLTFSPRGPRGLTVRVARGGALVEVPVADSPSGGPTRP